MPTTNAYLLQIPMHIYIFNVKLEGIWKLFSSIWAWQYFKCMSSKKKMQEKYTRTKIKMNFWFPKDNMNPKTLWPIVILIWIWLKYCRGKNDKCGGSNTYLTWIKFLDPKPWSQTLTMQPISLSNYKWNKDLGFCVCWLNLLLSFLAASDKDSTQRTQPNSISNFSWK